MTTKSIQEQRCADVDVTINASFANVHGKMQLQTDTHMPHWSHKVHVCTEFQLSNFDWNRAYCFFSHSGFPLFAYKKLQDFSRTFHDPQNVFPGFFVIAQQC